jgi:hypothetical protein
VSTTIWDVALLLSLTLPDSIEGTGFLPNESQCRVHLSHTMAKVLMAFLRKQILMYERDNTTKIPVPAAYRDLYRSVFPEDEQ